MTVSVRFPGIQSFYYSIMKTALVCLLSVLISAVFFSTTIKAQEIRPIQMDRRDLLPYGDIVSELKGKTMGGRMRFGKRSMGEFRILPIETFAAREQQMQQLKYS